MSKFKPLITVKENPDLSIFFKRDFLVKLLNQMTYENRDDIVIEVPDLREVEDFKRNYMPDLAVVDPHAIISNKLN